MHRLAGRLTATVEHANPQPNAFAGRIRRHDLPVLAIDLPGAETRAIARGGLAALGAAGDRLRSLLPPDPAREAALAQTLRDVHCGLLPEARILEVADLAQGLDMLLAGELDGFANVGIVLRAQIEHLQDQSRFVLLPRGGALLWESLACMLPQDDSRWRDLVNRVIADLLEGVEGYRGGWTELYERWFGVQGEVFYPLDQETAARLAAGRFWLD